MEVLVRAASRIRSLALLHPVESRPVTRQEAGAYVRGLLEREWDPKQGRVREEFLIRMGLLLPGSHLKKLLGDLYTEQIRGLYDPYAGRYLVVRRGATPEEQVLGELLPGAGFSLDDLYTIHELVHALQDQHFDLEALDRRVSHNFDQQMAAQSLLEGDASLVMLHYAAEKFGIEPGLLESTAGGADLLSLPLAGAGKFGSAPRFLQRLLIEPYRAGMGFVTSVKARGGWKAVDRAYRDLPASTEEVFHPEKYLRRDDPPRKIDLSALPREFGGWKAMGEDVAGEFTIRVWAEELAGPAEAAAGWGGDRYRLYSRGDEGFVVWATVWDTPRDAVEFEALARDALSREGEFQPDRGAGIWVSQGRAAYLARSGARVLILRGLPSRLLDTVAGAAWRAWK